MDTHILSEIEQEIYLQPATLGKRFLNLLLDILGFYALMFFVGIVLGALNPEAAETLFGEGQNPLVQYLISYLFFLTYYTLAEGATKGRSLGKLITGTIAVKTDGTKISWKEAVLRSLCRLVPFEVFSAFGQAPWHDKWTHTTVVAKSNLRPVMDV